jgi:hypothetical protein
MPKFRFGNLADDLDLIRQAREWAAQITNISPAGKTI